MSCSAACRYLERDSRGFQAIVLVPNSSAELWVQGTGTGPWHRVPTPQVPYSPMDMDSRGNWASGTRLEDLPTQATPRVTGAWGSHEI